MRSLEKDQNSLTSMGITLRKELVSWRLINTAIVTDENIKEILKDTEGYLGDLKLAFKNYCSENKSKMTPKEIDNRSKIIDLLRRNLNLLDDKFKDTLKARANTQANAGGGEGEGEGDGLKMKQVKEEDYEDRELTEEEKQVL